MLDCIASALLVQIYEFERQQAKDSNLKAFSVSQFKELVVLEKSLDKPECHYTKQHPLKPSAAETENLKKNLELVRSGKEAGALYEASDLSDFSPQSAQRMSHQRKPPAATTTTTTTTTKTATPPKPSPTQTKKKMLMQTARKSEKGSKQEKRKEEAERKQKEEERRKEKAEEERRKKKEEERRKKKKRDQEEAQQKRKAAHKKQHPATTTTTTTTTTGRHKSTPTKKSQEHAEVIEVAPEEGKYGFSLSLDTSHIFLFSAQSTTLVVKKRSLHDQEQLES